MNMSTGNFTITITAWRLNVVIPFQHNKILDKRLTFVKISTIYIDTSDGINMFAQFEITSMDHFTRHFNLSFSHCNILERLNISKSFILPPSSSIHLNMTMAVPFYTVQYKEQRCKGTCCCLLLSSFFFFFCMIDRISFLFFILFYLLP